MVPSVRRQRGVVLGLSSAALFCAMVLPSCKVGPDYQRRYYYATPPNLLAVHGKGVSKVLPRPTGPEACDLVPVTPIT